MAEEGAAARAVRRLPWASGARAILPVLQVAGAGALIYLCLVHLTHRPLLQPPAVSREGRAKGGARVTCRPGGARTRGGHPGERPGGRGAGGMRMDGRTKAGWGLTPPGERDLVGKGQQEVEAEQGGEAGTWARGGPAGR